MKKFSKLFLTLAVCLASAAMFSSCAQILNTMVYGSGPSKIEFTDSTNTLSSSKEFDIRIYNCDSSGTRSKLVHSGTYSLGSSINVSGKLTSDNYYEITIENNNYGDKHSIYYSNKEPNLSFMTSKLYFKASSSYNYKLYIYEITSLLYSFKLSEISK